MPMYEFICKSCGQQFEELKKYDENTAECPLCDGESERVMSSPNFVVSGSTNASVDKIIGEDAAKKWEVIHEKKRLRNKQYGNISEEDVKKKDRQRISKVLQVQNEVNTVINKAKQDAGITKKDELHHLLKG